LPNREHLGNPQPLNASWTNRGDYDADPIQSDKPKGAHPGPANGTRAQQATTVQGVRRKGAALDKPATANDNDLTERARA
jgi:hypothetical protein